MSHESNITRTVVTRQNNVDASIAQDRAERFLDNADPGGLSCEACALAGLCGAVSASLLETVGNPIPRADVALVEAHGITVSRNRQQLCPEQLVRSELQRTVGGEYWVAGDDPLREQPVTLQVADALENATQTLAARLRSGQRI